VRDYWTLIRPRIVALVLLAMTAAAWTAASKPPPWPRLLHALLGAALVIAGAVALNQRLELRGDAIMLRTAARPLPAGRLGRRQVTAFGLALSAAGLAYLVIATGDWPLVGLTALSWFLYVCTYTPLKSRSAWQTPIGAAAGAMPVLLGAAVAEAPFSAMALSLFAVVYLWQIPHAMAIAWLYRGQFAAAEVKLATVLDPSGRTAGALAVAGAAALLPASLLPVFCALRDWPYAVSAALLGAAYLAFSLQFSRRPDDTTARRLLRASLVYLPVLLGALMMSG
jgi:protoheme IX farnesyltransferase